MATYVNTILKNEVVQNPLAEDKYIIISGTNRADSNSYKIAQYYQEVIGAKNIPCALLTLENLDLSGRSEQYVKLELEILLPAQKFIFICPEYNGSIPGVLKTLLDLSDY